MSYVNFSNRALIEELYDKYVVDPLSVDVSWRYFFEGMSFSAGESLASEDLRVSRLIEAYRSYGHLLASFNPLVSHAPKRPEELSLKALGFEEGELNRPFPTCGFLKQPKAPLKQIIEALEALYSHRIGFEYVGIQHPEIEAWLEQRIEPVFDKALSKDHKMRFLHLLNRVEVFESFLHTKYPGQIRFSLEGEETLLPMLAALVESAAEQKMTEIYLGMAHRGRLNLLTNLLGKLYATVFHEFQDHSVSIDDPESGDVKYHKGYSATLPTASGGTVTMTLAANPSHLESVNPVLEGLAHGAQFLKGQTKSILPLLIHGDAALSGQGVIYETMQLSQIRGYSNGGTLHIVLNNQIGFTTLPQEGRSTRYCTDIARAFGAPVFHVSVEDVEGCIAVTKLALEIRQRFSCDVFIDLCGYRKYGHNEGDEPGFTQPLEYALIRAKKSVRTLFLETLIAEGVLDEKAATEEEAAFRSELIGTLQGVQTSPIVQAVEGIKKDSFKQVNTAVEGAVLLELAEKITTAPAGFVLHSKMKRLLQERLEMGRAERPLDFSMGEQLALASLLWQGIDVRLSGQDSGRGTFSQRHSLWVDQAVENSYYPLAHLKSQQGRLDILNSPLSENAVLGFEYGYSVKCQSALVMWEAQYGDFCNGAQVIIDQYIASGEKKWGQRSSLTLLLPHGYEGANPDHASGRIERFLLLAAEDNMRIVHPSTPAQLFHLLRRQALSSIKKPLIVFTPKGTLRHPLCVSPLATLSSGGFEEVIDEVLPLKEVRRLLICSGKIYYDLFQERQRQKREDCAIIRIEQLYPLHEQRLVEVLDRYQNITECLWVQEEHQNAGSWLFIRPHLLKALKERCPLRYVGRREGAATGTGSYALHKKQQSALVEEAFK